VKRVEDKNAQRFDEAAAVAAPEIASALLGLPESIKADTQEIRIRTGRPVMLCGLYGVCFLEKSGRVAFTTYKSAMVATNEQVAATLKKASGYSLYSHQESIAKGFITFGSGHRMGICGTAVGTDGRISNVRDASSLNIRIARDHTGCSVRILDLLWNGGIKSLIITGPPLCGKTTVLRDMARQLSSGYRDNYFKVSVVDERFELSNFTDDGESLGINCDVLRGCKKDEGIIHVVRSMAPEIVICDEIGSLSDAKAVTEGLNSGVKFILSVHSSGKEDFFKRPQVRTLLSTGEFETVVFLKNAMNPGQVEEIVKAGDITDEIYRNSHAGYNDICGRKGICLEYV
jgi:stage III sporulation protein AA